VRAEAVETALTANPSMRGTVADVGSDEDVGRLFDDAFEWMGHADVLVNGVGIAGPRAPIEELSAEDWNEVLNVNVTGFARCVRRALPGMKERSHGSIINFSSCSSHLAPPMRSVYVASKAAVEGLTRCVAREVGPLGVRCNAILPGAINNERLQRIFDRNAAARGITVAEYSQEVLSYVSLRRSIEMDEFAELVLFLCSDAARGISGQLIRLDGNMEWESP
jgi:NAD(P)-dependent dehydrogenase (short-subunit alcohol dehydrogenase family)